MPAEPQRRPRAGASTRIGASLRRQKRDFHAVVESPKVARLWPADYGVHSRVSELTAGVKDFDGKRLNVLQIGMGTFGNFVENLARPWDRYLPLEWLLEACSDFSPQLHAVGVEPAWEHAERCRAEMRCLPNSSLVQAALGALSQNVVLYTITPERYKGYLAEVHPKDVDSFARKVLFLQNMSCVGQVHPEFCKYRSRLEEEFGIKVEMEPVEVAALTYGHLSRMLNFSGVEVLIVDAEGHDCQILRGMVEHCSRAATDVRRKSCWPDVIQFETMGHSDKVEGCYAEYDMLEMLKQHGYKLACQGTDTQVVRVAAYDAEPRIRRWMETFHCAHCRRFGWESMPFSSNSGQGLLCAACDSLFQVFGVSVHEWYNLENGETQIRSIATDGVSLWGIRVSDGKACRFVGESWAEVGSAFNLLQVAPSSDGQMVWALTSEHQLICCHLPDETWRPVQNAPSLRYVAASDVEVWGLDEYEHIHIYCIEEEVWRHTSGLLSQVSLSKSGNQIWGANSCHEVWHRGGTGFWTQIEGLFLQWLSVSNDGWHVWGLTGHSQLFYRAGWRNDWLRVPGRLCQVCTTSDGSCVWGLDASGYVWAFRV